MKTMGSSSRLLGWTLALVCFWCCQACTGGSAREESVADSGAPRVRLLENPTPERRRVVPEPGRDRAVPPRPEPPREKTAEPVQEPVVDSVSDSGGGTVPEKHAEPVPETPVDPCAGIRCGTNAICLQETGKCACRAGTQGDPTKACAALPKPKGWIGSPCKSNADCGYKDAICLPERDGYTGGACSSLCTRFCPDKAGFPVTFCVEDDANAQRGLCLSRCDTQLFPGTGCRKGYRCDTRARFRESGTRKSLCVPNSWARPSGACLDLMNKQGDDTCYFKLLSFGNARQETLARRLLSGGASKAEALEYLEANYKSSQVFLKDELKIRTIQKNYSAGHRASTPMKGMILHYTANQKEDPTIRYFLGSSAHASTHFIIGSVRNGLLVQIFSHKHRTWHAGSYNQNRFGIDFANAGYLKKSGSSWVDYAKRKYTLDLPLHGNSPVTVTGGIPGANSKYGRLKEWQPYTYYQLLTFLVLGRALHLVYKLDPRLCQRHGDVSSSRVDPGPALPTTALLKLVFSKDDVLSVQWLRDFKQQKDWISKNPNAR